MSWWADLTRIKQDWLDSMEPDGVDRLIADEDPDVGLSRVAELLRQDLELELVALRDHISRQPGFELRIKTIHHNIPENKIAQIQRNRYQWAFA